MDAGEKNLGSLDLGDRRIVLGVTGGIAAYKAVELCRQLTDAGAYVSPVMTESAKHFLGATTLSALASQPVQTSLWSEASPIPHTLLGQSADLIVVAPATARFIGSFAAGLSDDLLSATLLATRAPVVIAPAMHTEMWEHPAVMANIATLAERGVHIVEPEAGRLAGGDVGKGRLAEVGSILHRIGSVLGPNDLHGVRMLVTAGGTREPIDPVRYISNRSSGKQGHAIAEIAALRGAAVTLVTTTELPSPPGINRINVNTAEEMTTAVLGEADDADIVIMAAAVADFRPAAAAAQKLKKANGAPAVELVATTDILAELGNRKHQHQTVVGFAAETNEVIVNATAKLAAKGADLIVANDVSAPSVGFGHDTNEVTIVSRTQPPHTVELSTKRHVASAIVDSVVAHREHLN